MTTLSTGTVIDETTWNGQNYTPRDQVAAAFGFPRSTSRVTIHHWGNDGQNFDTVANFLARRGQGDTSAHFVVEAGRVACIISPENAAWHAGNAEGNATSIGIECRPEMSEGDLNEVAALIAWLEDVYGPQEVWLHKEWFATACPGRYANMRDEIVRRVNAMQSTSGNAGAPPQHAIDHAAKHQLDVIDDAVDELRKRL